MFGRVTKNWVQSAIAAAVGQALAYAEAAVNLCKSIDARVDKLRSDFGQEVHALAAHIGDDVAERHASTNAHLSVLFEFCGLEIDKPHSLQSAKVQGLLPLQLKNRQFELLGCFNDLLDRVRKSDAANGECARATAKKLDQLTAENKELRTYLDRLGVRIGFLHARMNRQLGDNPDCELNLAEVALIGGAIADRTDMLATLAGFEFTPSPFGDGEGLIPIGSGPQNKPPAPKKKERKRK